MIDTKVAGAKRSEAHRCAAADRADGLRRAQPLLLQLAMHSSPTINSPHSRGKRRVVIMDRDEAWCFQLMREFHLMLA